MKIQLYRCFKSDHRISMDVYAESLRNSLQLLESASDLRVDAFVPRSKFEPWSSMPQVMRAIRYLSYPNQIGHIAADIHHVTDHGYAHLHPKLGTGKTCVNVHDLIPMLHWQGKLQQATAQSKLKKPRLNLYSLSYVNRFDRVLTISQQGADDVHQYLGVDRAKIRTIAPVIDSMFRPQSKTEIIAFAERYGLDRKAKWLMISGQEFYKNHQTSLRVLKALNQRSNSPVRLIKSGRPSLEFAHSAAELGVDEFVHQVFFDSQQELPLLYGLVDCLLFPSLYEGFGMPVAEAMACGTPVITSNRGSLPEVAGSLGIVHSPFDVDGIMQSVQSIFEQPEIANKFAEMGPAWVEQYRPQSIGKQLEQFYRELDAE